MPELPNLQKTLWETVALPLAKGVDLRTPGRGIPQQRLLKLENARFDQAVGVRKRRGHREYQIRDSSEFIDNGYSETPFWVFGRGLTKVSDAGYADPHASVAYGHISRDTETAAWTGYDVRSWPEFAGPNDGWQTAMAAVMPSLRSTPVAKSALSQKNADLAIGEGNAAVAWISPDTGFVKVSTYDPTTWAIRANELTLTAYAASAVRVLPCGEWIHVLVSTATTLERFSVHAATPGTFSAGASLGDCNIYFDARQVHGNGLVLVRRDVANVARVTYLKFDGTVDNTYLAASTALDTSPADGNQNVKAIAIAQHTRTLELCVAWQSSTNPGNAYYRVYTQGGVARGARRTLSTGGDTIGLLSIAPRWKCVGLAQDQGDFEIYWSESTTLSGTIPWTKSALATYVIHTTTATRWWTVLSHHAFRVGDRTFVGLRQAYRQSVTSPVQRTYFIADVDLKPVAAYERGTAATSMAVLPGVYFYSDNDAHDTNITRYHTIDVYQQRVDSRDNNQYDEESLKLVELDFLPKLCTAQSGRTTYIAGGQLHQYDGKQVVEAGFHIFPETPGAATAGVAGTPNGTYTYRARWAWTNAQGEEEVSATTISNSVIIVNQQIDVTVPTLGMTRKSGVYLKLYRNAVVGGIPGTQYYLVTSLDPTSSSYKANDPSVSQITFRDNVDDTTLQTCERDRLDSSLMEPFPAPACEVVAVGRDRVWVAGGEIARGDILPSMITSANRTAEFNTQILTPVTRDIEPITGFGFMGNSTLVFKPHSIYAFESDGPSNTLLGGFDTPRVISADTGAQDQVSIKLTTGGLLYQSTSGFKMLATNYQIVDVGRPVQPLGAVADIRAAVLVPADEEVRFYCANGPALVFSYREGEWSTWPNLECQGAGVNPRTGLAVLVRADGKLWAEEDGVWTDGGSRIVLKLRTAWLHAGQLQGVQRVRRIAFLGDKLTVDGVMVLNFATYYDDLEYPLDTWSWVVTDDLNTAYWGSDPGDYGWGSYGFWGDAGLDAAEQGDYFEQTFKDYVLGKEHRCKYQKCSRVSFEFDDGGFEGEGVALTEIGLEIGRKAGLAKTSGSRSTGGDDGSTVL